MSRIQLTSGRPRPCYCRPGVRGHPSSRRRTPAVTFSLRSTVEALMNCGHPSPVLAIPGPSLCSLYVVSAALTGPGSESVRSVSQVFLARTSF